MGVKKWKNTYSFEVSIELVHLFLIATKMSNVLKVWNRFLQMESRNDENVQF